MRLIVAVIAVSIVMPCSIGANAEPRDKVPGSTTAQRVLSPDGKVAVTLGGDALKVWDTGTGRLIRALQTGSGVAAFSFTPDGSHIVVVGRDNKRTLWELATGRRVDSE